MRNQKRIRTLLAVLACTATFCGGQMVFAEDGIVLGGNNNTASGLYSSVSGGYSNTASGPSSSVSGGFSNTASGLKTSVSGGESNTASGSSSSVSGGFENEASGLNSSVSGGSDNRATWRSSTVSGGEKNIAYGMDSSVSGGSNNGARGDSSSVSGGSYNKAMGPYSTVSGGSNNEASGSSSTVSGGVQNIASGLYSTVSGGFDNVVDGNLNTAVGGEHSRVYGDYNTGIAGGSVTGKSFWQMSNGYSSIGSDVSNAVAIGNEAVTDENGTIAFGHDAGDVRSLEVEWQQRTDEDGKGIINKSEDGTYNDYTKKPTITPHTYESASYNRLVKVADGIEDHDVATVGQLKKKLDADASNVDLDAWAKKLGTGKVESGNTGIVTGGTVYTALNNTIGTISNGNYIKASDNVGTNLGTLDTHVKANADAIAKEVQDRGEAITNITNNIGTLRGNAVLYDADAKDIITFAGTKGTKLTHLRDATLSASSTDAVTGRQLYATNQNITGFANQIKQNADTLKSLSTSVSSALSSVSTMSDGITTIDNMKADASLTNLSDAGKNVISKAATEAVQKYMKSLSASGTQSTVTAAGSGTTAGTSGTSASTSSTQGSTSSDKIQSAFQKYDYAIYGSSAKANNFSLSDMGASPSSLGVSLYSLPSANDLDTVTKDDLNQKADKASVYTKTETDAKFGVKADRTYVDAGLAKKADKDSVYTKTETDTKVSLGTLSAMSYADERDAELADAFSQKLSQTTSQLTHDINKVGAGAAALAGLHPGDFDPENKLDFAAGYGHYKGANAGALGAYYHPNEDTIVSLAGTMGNGDPMLSAGVTFKIGSGVGPNTMSRTALTKELAAVKTQNQQLVAQNEKLTSDVETLKAQVAQLLKQQADSKSTR